MTNSDNFVRDGPMGELWDAFRFVHGTSIGWSQGPRVARDVLRDQAREVLVPLNHQWSAHMRTTKNLLNGATSAREIATDNEAKPKRPRERTARPAMIHDPVLGPYRADATHWSCWRMDRAGSQKGTRLLWDDGSGVETNEWPIETWKHEVVPERWGAGRYVVQFLKITAEGRKPWGRSRVFSAAAPANAKAAVAVPAEEPRPVASPAVSVVPVAAAPLPVAAAASGNEAVLGQVFSILAYLEDRSEKVRDRAAAEAKINNERYRIDVEQLLERERIASKERIAIVEAQSRRPAPRESIDQEALALRIRDLVDESVRDALEEMEPEEPPPPPAPPDQGTALVMALKDVLAPLLPTILANLAPKLPPSGDGGNGGNGGNGGGPGTDGGAGPEQTGKGNKGGNDPKGRAGQ